MNILSYRRIALLLILLLGIIFASALFYATRLRCVTQSSARCGLTAFVVGMLLIVPLAWFGAMRWAKWYELRTMRITRKLERDYHQQVALVELQRTRLSTVLQYLADGVLLINDRGEVRYINSAAQRLLNTSANEAIGRTFASVAYHHMLIDLWHACLATKEEKESAIEIERLGVFVQAIITPIQPSDRVSFLVVLRDLTRIRRLETIRRDFISNVSHELLTPIASVRAVVETLLDGALDDRPMAEHFLKRAQVETESMSQLVSELLTLSRIESGVTEFKLSPVMVSELLLPPVERLVEQAERKKIELEVNIPADLPPVMADIDQVWHVITNMVHNALKHTSDGKIILSAKRKRDKVSISIKDTGVGIHPDDLPRIFERFYKADRSRNRSNAAGTGLGLAIAKHIVLAHKGEIWAESTLGRGSTFFFTLVVAQGERITAAVGD